MPVTLLEAAEGAKVEVPTPTGTVTLRIPPGSSSGTRLRIKGHGVSKAGKPAGDLYAEILVMLPKSLAASDIEQIRELCNKHPQTPRADLRW